ncbi:thiamine pyrophosphokinase [Entomoplasma ellychniae]|uniref:Thiamine diphosphokinase n=1 Tax=Entomoplasma ellychniae TaxID=2114 RepID=A0A8E2QZG2_9MOLU|nr:thiamine diphosphokinase [Entomoplasma ellychniae]PPE05018.1 thiamine pyrophosphokinase [Entomoplasma ellychniae]
MIKRVLIVCSESNINLNMFNNHNNFIIGVERGCLDLISKKIKIDLAISDFDRVLPAELAIIKDYAIKIDVQNCEKDYLDGELAILKAKEMYPNAPIVFISKQTKRYDMSLSAINLVKNYDIKFVNDETLIQKLPKGINELSFSNFEIYTYISFFAISHTKISIKNMKYNVKDFEFNSFDNKCISNALIINQNPIISTSKEIIVIASK